MSAYYAYVWFLSADYNRRRPKGLRRRFRIARRFPRRCWLHTRRCAVRAATRSQIGHCAVSYDGVVLDAGINKTRFYPEGVYVVQQPTLLCVIPVSVEPIDLGAIPRTRGPRPAWPSVLRWLSRGLFDADDCAACVRWALIDGGVPVPRGCVSPRQIHDWLLDRGYPHVRIRSRRTPAGQVCGSRGEAARVVASQNGLRRDRRGPVD